MSAMTMTHKQPSLSALRSLAAKNGVAERRDGQTMILSFHLSDEEITAHYDPAKPAAPVRLSITLGPMPAAAPARQKIIERALDINHAYARRFACGIALVQNETADTALALQSSLAARPATEDELAARLRLLAAAATRARELVARALPAH